MSITGWIDNVSISPDKPVIGSMVWLAINGDIPPGTGANGKYKIRVELNGIEISNTSHWMDVFSVSGWNTDINIVAPNVPDVYDIKIKLDVEMELFGGVHWWDKNADTYDFALTIYDDDDDDNGDNGDDNDIISWMKDNPILVAMTAMSIAGMIYIKSNKE